MVTIPEVTSHKDLMDLASRFAYRPPKKLAEEPIIVNGRKFTLVGQKHDPVTGLDAFTFENPVTGELTVAFEGTALGGEHGMADLWTDAALITAATPAQYQAALDYVAQVEREENRPVGSVCGNSLGGGLAAYVGALRPDLTAVTVNPAPVPAELEGSEAPNVHNYLTETDILRRLVRGGDLSDRVVGEVVEVDGTIVGFPFLLANHVGSDRGEGAYGGMYDASMAVPFSLFHPDTVVSAGGLGPRVEVTPEALAGMVAALVRQRGELETILDTELKGVALDLVTYARGLEVREESLRQTFLEAVDTAYRPIRWAVDGVEDAIASQVRRSLDDLPEPPGPLAALWRPIRVELHAGVDGIVTSLRELRELAVRTLADAAWQGYRIAFIDESRALTMLLVAQCQQLGSDFVLTYRKWGVFEGLAAGVHRAVSEADASAAAAIAAGTCPPDVVETVVPDWPGGRVLPLTEPAAKQFYDTVTHARQMAAGVLVTGGAAGLADQLAPFELITTAVVAALEALELALGLAVSTLRGALQTVETVAAPILHVTGTADDVRRFRERVGELYDGYRAESDEWQAQVADVGRALGRLPEVLMELRPYVESCFFSDAMIETTYDALAKCRNLADRSHVAFGEAAHHLDDHAAEAIDALGERAADVGADLGTAAASVQTMVA